MINPKYGNIDADMFVAGNSTKGKEIAVRLAKDIGFAECYDLGGDHRVEMLEQLAMIWVNLDIFQKQGRNIAFKILRKN
jgi:8-hydroxy-5-deazaflavin:NADPH oxidoreductase